MPPLSDAVREHLEHFERLSTGEIVAAGLLDGINPCAFTILVFLISWLLHSGRSRRDVACIGLAYTGAVFATTFAISFHALALLRLIREWEPLRRLLSGTGILVCGWLAFAHVRDARRFHRTGETGDLSVKLPRAIQERMHAAIRTHLSTGSLLAGAAATGALVAILESACSSQISLPVLWSIARSPELADTIYPVRALGVLAIYHAAFIVPMALVFAAAFAGTGSKPLADFARRHLATTHLALAILFAWLSLVLGLMMWRDFGAALWKEWAMR